MKKWPQVEVVHERTLINNMYKFLLLEACTSTHGCQVAAIYVQCSCFAATCAGTQVAAAHIQYITQTSVAYALQQLNYVSDYWKPLLYNRELMASFLLANMFLFFHTSIPIQDECQWLWLNVVHKQLLTDDIHKLFLLEVCTTPCGY